MSRAIVTHFTGNLLSLIAGTVTMNSFDVHSFGDI
jgi:hypothetical protein